MSEPSTQHTLPVAFRRQAQAMVIGASAGGIDALMQLLPGLPGALRVPIVVVLHLPPGHQSLLADVFASRVALPVCEALDKQPLEAGTIYFAPAGYHLLMEADRTFALSCDAPEHFSRPAIDVLFESAADALGPLLAAALLTGANDDGAAGLAYVARQGGLTVVQNPDEAQMPDMPRAALERLAPDFVLHLAAIHSLISQLEYVPWPPPSY